MALSTCFLTFQRAQECGEEVPLQLARAFLVGSCVLCNPPLSLPRVLLNQITDFLLMGLENWLHYFFSIIFC